MTAAAAQPSRAPPPPPPLPHQRQQHHHHSSFARLVAARISAMRRNSLLVVGSALLLTTWAVDYGGLMPLQLPLIVGREIERLGWITAEDEAEVGSSAGSSELDVTTIEFVRRSGYPVEEHFVTTEDGYVLALHRIPGSVGSGDASKAPTVLLHHALLESSFCWVIAGKERGLAFILADKGYDVWMANVRGNTYSRNHTNLLPSDPAFWNFSWHEMGMYDVPAEIEYITKLKNDDSLIYIGHSMGTTMFYAMASQRPDVASKIKAMFSLAPVAFTDHTSGPFWLIGRTLRKAQKFRNIEGKSEFLPLSHHFKFAAKYLCNRPILRHVCAVVVFSTVGYDFEQFNTTWLPMILHHTPAGTSLKTILHFSQSMESKRFARYDYGAERNTEIYGSKIPPEYDLSRIQVPIALFWAENDFLARPEDVSRLYDRLPRKIGMHRIENANFNHLDFLWGRDAPELVYARIIRLMENYRRDSSDSTA